MTKIKIKLGVPEEMVDGSLEDYKAKMVDMMKSKLAIIGMDEKDVDFEVIATKGEFFTKFEEETSEDNAEPKVAQAESTKLAFDKTPSEALKEEVKEEKEEMVVDNVNVAHTLLDDDESIEPILDGSNDENMEECCEECCCEDECYAESYSRELTNLEKNVALLKLYGMLNDVNSWQQINTTYGETYLTYEEKEFLLKKLFVESGLDIIAKEVTKVLENFMNN